MIDLVWVNEDMDDLIQVCEIDKEDLKNHFSDHQAIITRLNLRKRFAEAQDDGRHRKNWNKCNFNKLKDNPPGRLPKIEPLMSRESIEISDKQLQEEIKVLMHESSPKKATPGKHKAWWRLEFMAPLRQGAARGRKELKEENSPANQEANSKA